MKRYGYLYDEVTSFGNLHTASKKAMRGKKDKKTVAEFNFNLENEILKLQDELRGRTYEPRPLHTFKIREPKEREIGASAYRDRVVHHAVINVIEPYLERGYIRHSYACRPGKGTHRALKTAHGFTKRFRYYLKCDIEKYFASINHDVLKCILRRKFKDPDLLWLLDTIIDGPCKEKVGIPIGSLTSQHFANLYLDRLDHFVKDELGVKGYLRYMDDFILFNNDKKHLQRIRSDIEGYLSDMLRLNMNDRVTKIAPVSEGLPFIGFLIFPELIRIRHSNLMRSLRKLRQRDKEFKSGEISEDKYSRSLMSITEHLKMADTYHLRRDIFNDMFLDQ